MSHERSDRQLSRRILEQLAEQWMDLKPGNVYVLDVRHDSSCALLRGTGPCNCEPEIAVPQRVIDPEDN